jgi:hypothetical protein
MTNKTLTEKIEEITKETRKIIDNQIKLVRNNYFGNTNYGEHIETLLRLDVLMHQNNESLLTLFQEEMEARGHVFSKDCDCEKCSDTRLRALLSPKPISKEIKVTVCSKCLRACCWQGEFMCDDARTAGTEELSIKELMELDLEHPSYWKKPMKTPQPKDWQERWNKLHPTMVGLAVEKVEKDFIQSLLKEAVEAERARIESLIPEKKPECYCDTTYCLCEHIGFNEAISIMQEAVKGKC